MVMRAVYGIAGGKKVKGGRPNRVASGLEEI